MISINKKTNMIAGEKFHFQHFPFYSRSVPLDSNSMKERTIIDGYIKTNKKKIDYVE